MQQCHLETRQPRMKQKSHFRATINGRARGANGLPTELSNLGSVGSLRSSSTNSIVLSLLFGRLVRYPRNERRSLSRCYTRRTGPSGYYRLTFPVVRAGINVLLTSRRRHKPHVCFLRRSGSFVVSRTNSKRKLSTTDAIFVDVDGRN